MNVTFASPWVLVLLWLVPPAAAWWYLALRRRDRALLRFVSAPMQRKVRPAASGRRLRWQAALMALGLALSIVAAARPQWGTREETVYQRGRDLVIALDVSRSMLARDVHPNRLSRAKADLVDLIGELKGDRAALVAFRRSAVLLCPLTTDYTFLRQALDGVGIHSAPPGATDIGAAIEEALETFESDPGAHKAIILISDGEDLSGRASLAAEKAAERGIPIFTVGLGDRRGARIPAVDGKGHVTHGGKEVLTRLEHETLHGLAETSGGAYVPVGTAGMTSITLGTLYREHLRRITAQDIEETQRRRRVERYQGFLLLAVLFMGTATGLSPGRLKAGAPSPSETPPPAPPLRDLTPPKQELKAVVVFLALTLAAGTLCAATNTPADTEDSEPVPPGRRGARRAQRLYRLGRYEQAAAAYLDAARGSTKKSQADFRRNAAAALYRAGQYDRAADLLREVETMEGPGNQDTAQALGAALYRSADATSSTNAAAAARERARRLKESGEAFREAARHGGEETARDDLSLVLGRLPEAEEEARIATLMETHGNTPAFGLIDSMLSAQREILADVERASTNATPSRIREFEAAAEKQKKNADLWVPLKGKLLDAVPAGDPAAGTPAPADVEAYVEQLRDSMTDAAGELRDIDPRAPLTTTISEGGTYQLWKGMAPYAPLLGEDIRRQAAARDLVEAGAAANPEAAAYEQEEATSLTRLFVERFSEAVPEGGMPAPTAGDDNSESATNAPGGISAETREEILRLAAAARDAQDAAAAAVTENNYPAALPKQQEAHDLLKEIEELLPGEGRQDPQSGDPQSQEEDPQEPGEQESRPHDEPPSPGEQDPVQPDELPPPEEGREPEPDEGEDEDRLSEEELRRLIEKALQREKEHEEEKRRRARLPLPPTERDW